jgi:hypothetical protein
MAPQEFGVVPVYCPVAGSGLSRVAFCHHFEGVISSQTHLPKGRQIQGARLPWHLKIFTWRLNFQVYLSL